MAKEVEHPVATLQLSPVRVSQINDDSDLIAAGRVANKVRVVLGSVIHQVSFNDNARHLRAKPRLARALRFNDLLELAMNSLRRRGLFKTDNVDHFR